MTTPSDRSPRPRPQREEDNAPDPETGPSWHRQHPAACLFNALGIVRAMIFPIIAVILVAPGPVLFLMLGTILAASTGIALLRYVRYRYQFAGNELIIEQGWLFHTVRHVSYSRIQNINITRNILHRLFGVAGMQLESASGSEPEAVMAALAPAAIDELHARLGRSKGTGVSESPGVMEGDAVSDAGIQPEERRQILRIGADELVLHGLISNRGMVLVAAVLGYLFQGPLGERIFPLLVQRLARFTDRAPAEILEAMSPFHWFLFGAGVFLAAMAFLALLSVMYAVVRFHGFTLSADSESVRAEYGLFTRVAITIPKRRIQVIGFRANPFHRLCGRISLKVETAGGTAPDASPSSIRWLAPILPEKEASRLLRNVQPEVDWDSFEWRPLHARTRTRLLRVRLAMLAAFTMALVFATGITSLLALLLTPLVLAYARGYFRYSGWAVTPAAVAFRSGWIVKQQSVARYRKIQVVRMSRNPFDRRWGMATVTVDTAGANPGGHGLSIRFMDHHEARELRDLLEDRIRKTHFVW